MSYPVYYPIAGDVLPIFFSTYGGTNGESITMTGLAVTDVEIYKDGSVTQRSSDAGYTLLDTDGIDFDAITGIHGFSIDLGDNTDAGFYEVGPWYHVVVSAVTVDTQTVNFVAAAFRIVSATRGLAGTALPDAAADAAGGLPISDAGGLDLDAKVGALTFTVANKVDANATHVSGDSAAADAIEAAFDGSAGAQYPFGIIARGTAQSATATTIQFAAGETFADDEIIGATVQIIGGSAGVGQSRVIDDYVSATDTATVSDWTTTPTGTILYQVFGSAQAEGVAQTADHTASIAAILADTGTDGVVVAAASKTGYTLSAAGVQAIWDALTSALSTVSSIGKLLVDNLNATISSRATPAQVNTEVLDVLNTDTFAEPGQEAPAATNTLVKKIGYLFKFARNKVEQTSTTMSVYDNAGTTVDQKSTVSDDGTVYTRGEIGTGP